MPTLGIGGNSMEIVKRTVYVETSVVSYLTARPSGDLLASAWQKITADWWDTQRQRFELYTSDITIEEASKGDPQAASRRLEALDGIPILPLTGQVSGLLVALLEGGALPARSQADALHIAVSAVHGVDYLLTWNFRHLANATSKPIIQDICAQQGYASPEICSPRELMGDFDYV